jgi:hypothetical protein
MKFFPHTCARSARIAKTVRWQLKCWTD